MRYGAPHRPAGSAAGDGKMAALLAGFTRASCRFHAARPALVAAAAALPLRCPATPLGPPRPLSFSAAELVRAAPGPLRPYLHLMRLHQPAGRCARRGFAPRGSRGDAAANGGRGRRVTTATRQAWRRGGRGILTMR